MNCPTCGASNPEGALFCSSCGSPLAKASAQPENALFTDRPRKPSVPNSLPSAVPGGNPNPEQHSPDYSAYGSYTTYSTGSYIPPRSGNPRFNAAAIAGLVLGIFSNLCCIFPVVFLIYNVSPLLALIVPVIALLLNILGLMSTQKGLAIAGLVLACIALLITVYMLINVMSNPQYIRDLYQQIIQEQQLGNYY